MKAAAYPAASSDPTMATHDQEAGWARPSDVRGSSEVFREFPSGKGADDAGTVSYTHLTLPTILLV